VSFVQVPPLLGAGFHTVHHITYRHNYGHYTTYMDALFGCATTALAAQLVSRRTRVSCVLIQALKSDCFALDIQDAPVAEKLRGYQEPNAAGGNAA